MRGHFLKIDRIGYLKKREFDADCTRVILSLAKYSKKWKIQQIFLNAIFFLFFYIHNLFFLRGGAFHEWSMPICEIIIKLSIV
jgi:hypothetical protein